MFSDELIAHIREVKRTIRIDYRRLDTVIENLKFLYWSCLASEQLLIDAAEFTFDFPRLAQYYESHLKEERGEIEILVEDLESGKVDVGEPDHIAMAMIGTQYYLIKHINAAALLGYMAVQEADPTPIEIVEALERMHGKNLFRFVRMHAIKDLEHRKELIEVIDLAPKHLRPLILNSADSALGYMKEAAQIWQTTI
jgi:hypothetical protein